MNLNSKQTCLNYQITVAIKKNKKNSKINYFLEFWWFELL